MVAKTHFSGIVLSAGFGTRLAPLTDEIPKPLLPVGDIPVLGHSLRALRAAGATRLVVNTHYYADKIFFYINSLGFDVRVSHEEIIRGTAGGVAAARGLFSGSHVLIANGDIVGELPIDALLEAADEGLVLATTPRRIGEGTVGLGTEGRVVRLRGQTFGREVAAGDYMGVALAGPRCLESLPSDGCLIGDWALPELRAGGAVRAIQVHVDFRDIGTPSAYLAANLAWLSRQKPAGTGASYSSHQGEGTQVEPGVRLVESIVGPGARVRGAGEVRSSLVLPGATAVAPLSHAIVTPAGRVIHAMPRGCSIG